MCYVKYERYLLVKIFYYFTFNFNNVAIILTLLQKRQEILFIN